MRRFNSSVSDLDLRNFSFNAPDEVFVVSSTASVRVAAGTSLQFQSFIISAAGTVSIDETSSIHTAGADVSEERLGNGVFDIGIGGARGTGYTCTAPYPSLRSIVS